MLTLSLCIAYFLVLRWATKKAIQYDERTQEFIVKDKSFL